jgi:hypothetical protein
MTLDIRGSLKNTKLSSNSYVVFEELLSNAIDSYLIRKHSEPSAPAMDVVIEVGFQVVGLFEDQEAVSIVCRDNGCGLGDDQLKAFLTKDTSYKDDLLIAGIGKCKGAGRIQYFHHFAALTMDSTYREAAAVWRRQMSYAEPQKQIDFADFSRNEGVEADIGTSLTLSQSKESVRSRTGQNRSWSELFSAPALKKELLVAFLQRLVGLKARLGDFRIEFRTQHWKGVSQVETLRRSDLPEVTVTRPATVEERDPTTGEGLGVFHDFTLSHYRLDAAVYDLPKNAIALCAKSSPVQDITGHYLKTRAEQNRPIEGCHHILLVESEFLDQHVNEQRDSFDNIPSEIPSNDLFGQDRVSYADIHTAIDPIIATMVAPANWTKDEVVKEITEDFGVSEAMLTDTTTRIRYGESAQSVVERVLKKYQERVIDETAEIISLKAEIIEAQPDTEEFRQKINELSWTYTASLKNFDMANLSQLVVRRAAIVEILALACGKSLAMQAVPEGSRRKDERIIHSIFFPMRRDSSEVKDHDIWLLSEEYQYYDYIASDVPLSSIRWDDGHAVFEADVDAALQAIFAKRVNEHRAKRPDIALFTKEGAAIIVEFKAPGEPLEEHVSDLNRYAHLLAAKSGGRLNRFYGYLVGDTLDPLGLSGTWQQFPTGTGWFQTAPLVDPPTRQRLGELYSEILFYDDVVERAQKRIRVYQNKLNLRLKP